MTIKSQSISQSALYFFVGNFKHKNIMGCQGGKCIHVVGKKLV